MTRRRTHLTTNSDALANRLGALALRLSDLVETAVTEAGARSLSAATALSALDRFLDQSTIGQLGDVLGLSSSATVRLVDGLVAADLVRRDPGEADARQSTLQLTRRGRSAAKRIVAARQDVLARVLEPVTGQRRALLAGDVEDLLVGLVTESTGRGWMCRLCNTAECGAEPGQPCPITQTALGVDDK